MRIPKVNLHISRKAILLAVVFVLLLIQAGPSLRTSREASVLSSQRSPTAELDQWLEQPGVTVVDTETLPRVQRVRLPHGVVCVSTLSGPESVEMVWTR